MKKITNAKILTLDNSYDIFEGEIHIDGDSICYIGEPVDGEFDEVIDAGGNLVMPSFKNAHTHSAMTFLRSYADDLPLMDWLNKQVFPMEAKLTEEDVYVFSKLAILEYLSSGITACFDMYMKIDSFAKAMIDSGFKAVICSSLNDFGGSVEQTEEDFLKFNSLSPLISYRLGLHAQYTTKLSTIKGIVELCQKYEASFWSHNSETKDETDGCYKEYNMSPTALFDSLGAYEYGGGGYHCVYISDPDIEIFKKKGLWVVTNAGSNTKLASGIADITKLQKQGVNLAVGTDGAASNNALDMFREMYLITGLQKLKYNDAAVCPAEEVLKMATVGGAYAMGLDDCDVLAVGKKADLIILDLHKPNMQPENNIVKNIVYSGSKQNVKLTMINGEVLYRDGEYFLDESEEDIYAHANRLASEIKIR
ncbi:MAG: amidohydrolase [Ruminococcus sp.]|nr:amidohydrolase [Ruminococcus sp.]